MWSTTNYLPIVHLPCKSGQENFSAKQLIVEKGNNELLKAICAVCGLYFQERDDVHILPIGPHDSINHGRHLNGDDYIASCIAVHSNCLGSGYKMLE